MSTIHRATILSKFGATLAQIDELLAYNNNNFTYLQSHHQLASEPHLATWRNYLEIAETQGVFNTLKSQLVQLQFPIQHGISELENYRAVTRKGVPYQRVPEATGLILKQPDNLELKIHESLVGPIPVIVAGCRTDFVKLIQALTRRNEPVAIPASMGASIIRGYNNWGRITQYREKWQDSYTHITSESDWQQEFQNLIPQKNLYQDCFIVLSQGAYSAVQAAEIGLDEATWLRKSLVIRLEHECTHYVTGRLFGSMRNNILDELIADYRGIVAATRGEYFSDWFLRFIGLENYPHYREGGRLENYFGVPPLTLGSVRILQALVRQAACNLQLFHDRHRDQLLKSEHQLQLLTKLTMLTLEEIAEPENSRLQRLFDNAL